jgi:hypothetical protein
MLDPAHIWLAIETEEDKKLAEEIKQKTLDVLPYKTIEKEYPELKQYFVLHELQIGHIEGKNYDIIAGELEIDGLVFKVNGFVPIVTLGAYDFKKLLEYLTKDIHPKRFIKVKIMYCCKNQPVWVEVRGRYGETATGVIATKRTD